MRKNTPSIPRHFLDNGAWNTAIKMNTLPATMNAGHIPRPPSYRFKPLIKMRKPLNK
ncbi:MAG TPA: hypothetical protein PLE78_11450 [Flavobacteriales bacterium]|nr:hypothetical protein [Flavobacteriales bacterium]HQV76098.1 hypothetical protein [Flavobacteriales bacterium]HQW39667.1 hypothetical protein [Flavobacteriales bacterium]